MGLEAKEEKTRNRIQNQSISYGCWDPTTVSKVLDLERLGSLPRGVQPRFATCLYTAII